MIYYRRYIGSYQKRTARLSMRDHGAYSLMLDFYYAEEQPLPLEIEDIYDICKARTPDDRKSIAKVLRLHFERRADGYHNLRADEELAASATARTNGKRGGRPPGSKTGNGTDDETETETDHETETETEPETESATGTVHPSTYNHLAFQPSAFQPSNLQRSTPLAPSDESLGAGDPAKGRKNGHSQGGKNGHCKALDDGPTVIAIPLVGEREYQVHQGLVDELDRSFPAVDAVQTLREIRAWNLANARERKTANGVLRHINRWFQKEQNRG